MAVVITGCLLGNSVSEAVLFINPTRLVFEGRTRSATIIFLNQNTESTTYRLYWREMRQDDKGKFVTLGEDDEVPWSLRSLIRYSPRQVTLGPQQTQVIRFALRKPKDLPTGEYRSHLVIQEQPKIKVDKPPDENQTSLGIEIDILYAYTIPVLVEHGDMTPKAGFRDLTITKIEGDEWQLEGLITNNGSASTMGHIILEWEDGEGRTVVGQGGAHNVYLPQRERPIKVLYKKPNTPGRLRVAYYDDRHAKRKGRLLPSMDLLAEAYPK